MDRGATLPIALSNLKSAISNHWETWTWPRTWASRRRGRRNAYRARAAPTRPSRAKTARGPPPHRPPPARPHPRRASATPRPANPRPEKPPAALPPRALSHGRAPPAVRATVAGLCAAALVAAVVPLAVLQIPGAIAWSLPSQFAAAGKKNRTPGPACSGRPAWRCPRWRSRRRSGRWPPGGSGRAGPAGRAAGHRRRRRARRGRAHDPADRRGPPAARAGRRTSPWLPVAAIVAGASVRDGAVPGPLAGPAPWCARCSRRPR